MSVEDLADRFRRWERRSSPDGGQAWFNWTVRERSEGVAVGWVQATVAGDRAEIAYATVASQRGLGYGAAAVAAMVDWLRSRGGVRSVEAHIARENLASAALARAVGLRASDAIDDGEVVWVMPE